MDLLIFHAASPMECYRNFRLALLFLDIMLIFIDPTTSLNGTFDRRSASPLVDDPTRGGFLNDWEDVLPKAQWCPPQSVGRSHREDNVNE
jgi:hypothetical protein